ncbi:MAG: hypothetical protein WD739_11765 [Actinomycetota bacterium]
MSWSTVPTDLDLRRLHVSRAIRRVGIILLVVLVGVGATGWLGVKSGAVSASAAGTGLDVRFARVARPGLAAPLVIDVRRDGGFAGRDVVVEISTSYLAAFDWNTMFPDPLDQVREGDRLVLTFPAPEADRLRITLDARLSPSVQAGFDGTVAVREAGERIVAVAFRTEVMP